MMDLASRIRDLSRRTSAKSLLKSVKRAANGDTAQQAKLYAKWLAAYDAPPPALVRAVGKWARQGPLVSLIICTEYSTRAAANTSKTSAKLQAHSAVEVIECDHSLKEALSQANGAYTACLFAGDVLSPHALALLSYILDKTPEALFVFSDEDEMDAKGALQNPHMKPNWNADYYLLRDFASRLALFRTDAAREIALPDIAQTVQLHSLLLSLSLRAPPLHAAFPLYHRAVFNAGAAETPAEFLNAAQHYLTARAADQPAAQIVHKGGTGRVLWPLPTPSPRVSLIIPTRDRLDLLKGCVEGLRRRTHYPDIEIIIADNESQEPATLSYFDEIRTDARIMIVSCPGPFNFSKINNQAVQKSSGAIIGLINNDIEVIEPDWLDEMARQAWRAEVGAVGAFLLFGDSSIQHAGCVLGIGGVASHIYKGKPGAFTGPHAKLRFAQEMSAVTAACLLTRRDVWERSRGLDEDLAVAYNDVDYCLRVRAEGLKVIWTPYAKLFHLESASRGSDKADEKKARLHAEKQKMFAKWGDALQEDPFFNLNLSLYANDAQLAVPPRSWR